MPNINKVIYGNDTLIDLTDSTISENNMLDGTVGYDASGTRTVGTVTVPSDLDDLSDVSITSASDGQVLTYDNGDWVNADLPADSDEKVKQDVATDNSARRVLLSYSATDDVQTNKVYKNTDFTYNTSTGEFKTKNGTVIVDKILTNENLNDIKTSGFYQGGTNNTCTNKPSTIISTGQFGLLVIHSAASSVNYYTQFCFKPGDGTFYKRSNKNGTWESWAEVQITDTNTTYTISGGTNKITVTPSSGDAYDVSITPSISNNITGSGTRTSGYLAKFSGTDTITNGPQIGSDTTKYLRNDGTWDTPLGSVTGVKGASETSYRTGNVNLTPANIGAVALTSYGGLGTASIGANRWVDVATLTVTQTYADFPIMFEVSGRGINFTRVTVRFKSENGTDPSLTSFITDNSSYFYIKKTATSTWKVYYYSPVSYGILALHRISGLGANNKITVTVNMTVLTEEPTDLTQAVRGGSAGSATSADTATKLGSSNVGTATKPIYLASGTATACTYELNANVSSGTANRLVRYSDGTTVSNAPNLTYVEANSIASAPAAKKVLHIYGTNYGNEAASMISGTAGFFSYGDGGPQIDFSSQETLGSGQCGALIFTNNDTAATGASWHFVTTESDWNVISKRFHARTAISIGTSLPPSTSSGTQYALAVTGTANITSNTTIGGTLGVTGQVTGTAGGNSYYKARDLASFKNATVANESKFYPTVDIKTYEGDWSIGALGNGGEYLYFCHTTDTNYTGNTNKTRKYRLYAPTDTSDNNTYNLAYITSATDGQIMVASGTGGAIKSSGYTIATSVPSNAVFTDTKVTSSANHYSPSTSQGSDVSASATGGTASWSIDVVQGVTLNTDGKGHVTGLSVTSGRIPANPNTDTKVRQTLASDNTNRPLLLSYANNSSSTENVDNISYRCNTIYANASTGKLYVGTLDANELTGDLAISASAITIANGDRLVITHNSDSSDKLNKTSITFDGSTTTKCLTQKGTWESFNNYSLPLAASGTRGGIKIGYSESGTNYAVKLDSEKAYVSVPWTDTKNTAGSTDTSSKIFLIGATSQGDNPQTYSDDQVYVTNGTLTLSKSTDASGTANNKPALIVGGTDTQAHLEFDANEIMAKGSGTTTADLYINNDGGKVSIGKSGIEIKPNKVCNGLLTGSGTVGSTSSDETPVYKPSTWKFNTTNTVANGDIIYIKIPANGHANGVSVSIDNGTTYNPAIISGSSLLTTHYSSGQYIMLVYESATSVSAYPSGGGTAKESITGCWRVINFYNTNNNVTQTATTTNATYEILFSATADNTTRTEGARKTSTLTYNPSSKVLTVGQVSATTITGSTDIGSGNSTKAIRMASDRTIKATGTDSFTIMDMSTSQKMILATSNETDYKLFLGVNSDSVWTLAPNTSGKLGLGSANRKWGQIYSTNSSISTSDRTEKKDIVSLDNSAKDLIMSLNPVSYKLINGTSGRTHYGMIAQDVEETLDDLGMTAMDCAAFCKDQKRESHEIEVVDEDGKTHTETRSRNLEGEYTYGLRYEEFIAPMIKTIQIQQQEIDELKSQIKLLLGGKGNE